MKRASSLDVASIVVGNLVTLAGVLFGGMTPGFVAGTYLVEICVVGLLISFVPLFPSMPWEDKGGDFPRWKGALYLFLFACVHGGGAALIMSSLFGGIGDDSLIRYVIENFPSFWYAAVALLVSNAIALYRWVRAQRGGKGYLDGPVAQFLRLTIAATMFIFPGLLLGEFASRTFSSPLMGSIVVLTKTGADVFMYYRLSGEGF